MHSKFQAYLFVYYYYYKRILLECRTVKKTSTALNNNKIKSNCSVTQFSQISNERLKSDVFIYLFIYLFIFVTSCHTARYCMILVQCVIEKKEAYYFLYSFPKNNTNKRKSKFKTYVTCMNTQNTWRHSLKSVRLEKGQNVQPQQF